MALGEKKAKSDPGLLWFLVAVYVISFGGYLGLRRGLASWYAGLLHPPAAAPAWSLGLIWTFLSLLLSYIGWQLWTAEGSKLRSAALSFFLGEMAFHSLWAWLLFGVQKPIASLVVMGVLGVFAITCFVVAHRLRTVTALLFVPFLLWLFYASYLNYGLWSLNYRNGAGVSHIESISEPN